MFILYIVCWRFESRSIQLLGNKIGGHVEHGFVDAREVQFIWHVSSGASTLDIKKHVQEHLHGQTPESFDEGIMFMFMFNDVEWTKIGSTEIYSHNAQEVAVVARQLKPGHWCFLGPPSRNFVVERKFQRASRKNEMLTHCMVDVFV